MPFSSTHQSPSLFQELLHLSPPWSVADVALDPERREMEVRLRCDPEAALTCPSCGAAAARYGAAPRRRWRHLDTQDCTTYVVASVPRIKCAEHGVLQLPVSWAEENARHTRAFERKAIDLLRDGYSIHAVGRHLGMSWSAVRRIQERAVARGQRRQAAQPAPVVLGVDETSFQRGHEYVTVAMDQFRNCVRYVADDRKSSALRAYYEQLGEAQRAGIQAVAIDFWRGYITPTRECLPDADDKICHDWFHVVQLLNRAVDETRRRELRRHRGDGRSPLVGSRMLLLAAGDRRAEWSAEREQWFAEIERVADNVAAAWKLKEMARSLRKLRSRTELEAAWARWIQAARDSGLPAMVRVARTIEKHLRGIINAIVKGISNARTESLNARIQRIKRNACGYRNRRSFRIAILFHCGGLDLYPDPA